MLFDGLYDLDRKVTYKGIKYRVVEKLSSGLLLVVKLDATDNEEYPITPMVIPDTFTYE